MTRAVIGTGTSVTVADIPGVSPGFVCYTPTSVNLVQFSAFSPAWSAYILMVSMGVVVLGAAIVILSARRKRR